MLANGVKETTATTGTGTVTLTAVTGRPRFSSEFAVGELVAYGINNGDNWEWGIGTVGATNTLARTLPTATYVSGVYDNTAPPAITLAGTSDVICTNHAGVAMGGYITNKSNYFIPGSSTCRGLLSSSQTAARQIFCPFIPPRTIYVNLIGCNVTTAVAGSTVSVGIYANVIISGNDKPGVLLASASALDSTTTGLKTGVIAIVLKAGQIYWASSIASHNTALYSINSTVDGIAFLGTSTAGTKDTGYYETGAGSTLAATANTVQTVFTSYQPAIYLREA